MAEGNSEKSVKRIWIVFVICLLLVAGVIWYLVPVSMPNHFFTGQRTQKLIVSILAIDRR